MIPMARSAVARQLVKLGGRPEYRQNVVTDNGNVILDVYGMEILDPIALENAINAIPGVVTVGLFANRGADVALIGTPDGVKTIVNDPAGRISCRVKNSVRANLVTCITFNRLPCRSLKEKVIPGIFICYFPLYAIPSRRWRKRSYCRDNFF